MVIGEKIKKPTDIEICEEYDFKANFVEIRGLSAQIIVYDNSTYRKHGVRAPTFHLCAYI